MGALTTHVLDTANGIPAAGLKIELWAHHNGDATLLKTSTTNQDGRLDKPALSEAEFKIGQYELRFFAGDYFRKHGKLSEPAFLDIIPLMFGIADADSHYHVPLLVSPYSYSTYRGS
ncbi:MAG: hydroxyisourate hydrolase [Alphaproteobacteria bacterium]|nr:hydroxyisourate hydrolase [Alphaproteobacteria bacterium]